MRENIFTPQKVRSRRYPAQTITDADYADDIALLTNTPAQAGVPAAESGEGSRWHWSPCELSQNRVHVCDQKGDISTLNGDFLKLLNKFTYPGSCISSTEKDINMSIAKAWTSFDRSSII